MDQALKAKRLILKVQQRAFKASLVTKRHALKACLAASA